MKFADVAKHFHSCFVLRLPPGRIYHKHLRPRGRQFCSLRQSCSYLPA